MFNEMTPQEQVEFAKIQNDKLDTYRKKSLTNICYKILTDLTSSKGAGIRRYQRNNVGELEKYLTVSKKSIEENLEIESITEEIKILYAKDFIYIKFGSDFYEEFEGSMIDIGDNKILANMVILYNDQAEGNTMISLTEKGATELLNYNIKKSEELILKTEENQAQSSDDIKKLENAIKKFHEDIFTIFSLMLAVFAIIGLNVTAIPKISEHFIRNIVMINLTICFSLCAVFTLLNTMLYKEKNPAMWKLLGLVSITLLIAISVMTFK